MRVVICDDEPIFRQQLADYISRFSKENLIQIDVLKFSNGADLLATKENFDIVFLDYQMPGIDGMETARRLRAKNVLCHIIFVTNYPSFVLESFEVSPFRFLPKPITEEQIVCTLFDYLKKQKDFAPILLCNYNGQRRIPYKDIVYVKGDGKYSIIKTDDEMLDCSKTVAAFFEALPKYCFIRIHKSFVVNMYYIERLDNRKIYLTTGEELPIGRTHYKTFKSLYPELIKKSFVSI